MDSTSYVYTKDHLGSIWQVVDDDGETITSMTTYSPWGEQAITGAGPHSSFGYTGHLRHSEPTDVALAQYRGYDPKLGRWLSRDPIGENDGPNLHAYVNQNPVVWVDPDGLSKTTGVRGSDWVYDRLKDLQRQYKDKPDELNRCVKELEDELQKKKAINNKRRGWIKLAKKAKLPVVIPAICLDTKTCWCFRYPNECADWYEAMGE